MLKSETPHPAMARLVSGLLRMRVKSGQTQREVADEIGVTTAALSYIENGHRTPRLETLLAYADAVGADIAVIRRRGAVLPEKHARDFRGVSRRVPVVRVVP